MSTSTLAARVAAADPVTLLPLRHRAEAARITGPLVLRDQVALAERLVLLVVEDADGIRYPVPAVADGLGLRRAEPGDGASRALVAALASREPGDETGGFRFVAWHTEAVASEHAIDVDQSNESVVVRPAAVAGTAAVVKWTVRSTPGPHPAPSRLARLADAGFDTMPRPWGMVLWSPGPSEAAELVATVVDLVPGAEDGWTWAVDDVRALARSESDLATATAPAGRLGAIVARLHLALADVVPPAADAAMAAGWRDDARTALVEARTLMDGPEAARLERHADALAEALDGLGRAAGTPLVPVHGDLHVGQVLRGSDGAYRLTDFDGNPVATGTERTTPQPTAVDVAGMLQSLDHVAYVVLHRTRDIDTEAVADWQHVAAGTFLEEYRAALASAGRADLLDESLLDPLRLRQICREYVYAGRHLPHWRYVPDRALAARFDEPPPPTGLGA